MSRTGSYKTIRGLMLKSLVLIFLIPAIIVWISFFISMSDALKKNSVNEQITITNSVNVALEKMILEVESTMDKMTSSAAVLSIMQENSLNSANSDLYNAYDALNKIIPRTMNKPDNVILVNMSGGFYSYNAVANEQKVYFRSDEFLQKVRGNRGKPVIIPGLKNINKEDFFLIAKPIININDLQLLGVIGVYISTKSFEHLGRQLHVYSDNITFINADKRLIYSKEPGTYTQDLLNKKENSHGEIKVNGRWELYVGSDKNSYGIQTVNFVSVAQINKELIEKQLSIMITVLVVMGLVTFLLLYVYKKIYKNIKRISSKKTNKEEVEYFELKQIDEQIASLISTKKQGEEKIVKLINRCDTITLDKLQAQINPHFLYNTLTSIKYMAMLNGQKDISEMITSLVKLLKSTVNRNGSFITLSAEVENAVSYMHIQNAIYENSIEFIWNYPDNLKNSPIPNFIVQPLLENCIFHGIHPEAHGGVIKLNVFCVDNNLLIDVEDNGDGFDEEFIKNILTAGQNDENKQGFTNLGIKGVQDKIQILCGKDFGISVKSERGSGSRVRITLPLKKEEKID